MKKISPIIILFLFMCGSANASTEKESFYISSQTIINGEDVYVGGNHPISNLSFLIDQEIQEKTCVNEFFCKITIKTKDYGDKILKIDKSNFETKKVKILPKKTKTPIIYTKKIKLNKETKFSGKNLTKTIKLHTSFGIFEVSTNKKSFRLKIPTQLTALSETLKKSPIYVENSDGSISDIIIAKYEI